jgi:hypothetical protein
MYVRKCKKCGSDVFHKNEVLLNRAIKQNKVCVSCAQKEAKLGPNNGMYGKKHKPSTIDKIKEKRKQQIFTDETKNKLSILVKKRLEEFNHWLGRVHTDESRKKMRKSAIEYIETVKFNGGQLKPKYNINSISIIEEYGKKHGYNFLHAENGGEYYIKELGYYLDAYDTEKNVVLEVDERRHRYYTNDRTREDEITNFLGCKFIRINI